MSGDRLAAWAGRIALSLFGAALGGLVASLIDGLQAVGAAAGGVPGLGPTFLADEGVIAPVAALLGVAVGFGLVVLEPAAARTPASLLRSLDGGPDTRERAAALLLAPPAAFAWLALVAQDARQTFAIESAPRAAGASLAVGAALLAAGLGLLVARAARGLGGRLPRGLRPSVALAASLALGAALLAYGISSGTTGGEGGALGIFGVLKRAELDLRAPGLVLLIAGAGALGAGLHRRLFAPLAAALSLLPLVLTLRSARALDDSAALTASIERQAPLGKIGLRLARRLTDADHDGFSRTFGGGDCNDRDARIYPTAIDEPGNGIDEDCSGQDAPLPPVAPPPTASAARPSPVAAAREPLNVLLITVDTLRSDLGFNGNPRPVSPSLDALAARSTVFENGYSLASYTGKSIGPMMMGKYPSESHRGWSHFNSFSKEDTMVADRLKSAGVHTLSLQAHWYFNECCGLARGFETVDKSAGPPPGTQQDNDTNTTSDRLTDAAIKRLSDPQFTGNRFFTWVHYLDPHADYLRHPGTPDFGRGMRDQYDHEVAFTDQHIGRLLDFVAQQPWAAHTAIIVTSDHGEAFGEHKLIRHGFEVWEELMRVPLIVYVPGQKPSRVKPRRSLIDLVPTVLDLASVRPAFDGGPFDFISGKSLLPDISLAPGETPEERDIFVDMPAGPNNDDRRAYYHGNQKLYISSGYSYTLYDLAADPGEKTDLAESQKESLLAMKSSYEAFKARLREVRVKPIPK